MTVLAAPIAADTGWSLGSIPGALSAAFSSRASPLPNVGGAISRHGRRPVRATGGAKIGAGLAVMALSPAFCGFHEGGSSLD